MKFCVIRTRRRHVVFTFIVCVCLEGIGAHIHSKVLAVVLYYVKLSLFALDLLLRRTNDLSGKRALWKNDYSWAIPQLYVFLVHFLHFPFGEPLNSTKFRPGKAENKKLIWRLVRTPYLYLGFKSLTLTLFHPLSASALLCQQESVPQKKEKTML